VGLSHELVEEPSTSHDRNRSALRDADATSEMPKQTKRIPRKTGECSLNFEPEILMKWPLDKEIDSQCIADFCMPSGVMVQAYPGKSPPHPLPPLSIAPLLLKNIRQKYKARIVNDDWRSFAAKYDTNRCGAIDGKGFMLLMRAGLRVARNVLSDSQVTKLFRELDTHNAQRLSLDQIHSLFESETGPSTSLSFKPPAGSLEGSNPHREYVFRLTGGGVDGTEVHYGVCLQTTVLHRRTHFDGVIDKRAEMQRCVCIISRYPFISFFLQILRDLVQLLNRDDMNKLLFDEVVASYVGWPVPAPGTSKNFFPIGVSGRPATQGTFELSRPAPRPEVGTHSLPEEIQLLREWALPILFSAMSIDNILMMLSCAMREMHVLVVAENLQLVSAAIWSLVCLLHPLKWANPLIVTVPNTLYEFLDSPIPPLLGIEELPNSFEIKPGVVIVRPDQDKLLFYTDEEMLPFPQFTRLCRELKGHESTLRGRGGLVPPVMQNVSLDLLQRSPSPAWGPLPPSAVHLSAFEAIAYDIQIHVEKLIDVVLKIDEGKIFTKLQGLGWSSNNSSVGAATDLGHFVGLPKSLKVYLDDAGQKFMACVLSSQMAEVYCYEAAAKKHEALHRGNILAETGRLVRSMNRPKLQGCGHLPEVTAKIASNHALIDLFHVLLSRGKLSGGPDSAISSSGKPTHSAADADGSDVRQQKGQGDVLWCNGLCNGEINTPLCTSLCLQHWQNRYVERMQADLFKKAATAGIANFNEASGTQMRKKNHRAETPSQWRRARWRQRIDTQLPKSKLTVQNEKLRVLKKHIRDKRRTRAERRHWSAVGIQSATRAHLRGCASTRQYTAAVLIQSHWRGAVLRSRWQILRPLRLKIAVRKIQIGARTFLSKPVARISYMDLVAKVEKSAAQHAAAQPQDSPDRHKTDFLDNQTLRSMASPRLSAPSEKHLDRGTPSGYPPRKFLDLTELANNLERTETLPVVSEEAETFYDVTIDSDGNPDIYLESNEERDAVRLEAFKLLLLNQGVVVVKHGRIGGMKRRMLTCDDSFTNLMWSEEEPATGQGTWEFVRRRMKRQNNFRSIPFEDLIGASARRSDTQVLSQARRRRSSFGSSSSDTSETRRGTWTEGSNSETKSAAQSSLFAVEHGSDASSDAGMSRRRSYSTLFKRPKFEPAANELGYAFTVSTRRRNIELETGDELLMKRLVDGFNLLAHEVRLARRACDQAEEPLKRRFGL
jgi:hypothetical protein